MATRVYELSKKFGIANKELLEILRKEGFEVASHMAVVSPEAEALLEKKLTGSKKPEVKPEVKKETKKEVKPEAKAQEKPAEKQPIKKATEPIKEQVKEQVKEQEKHEQKPVVAQEKVAPEKIKEQIKQEPEEKKSNAPEITIAPMSVAEIATIARKPVSEVIITLLKQGVVAAKNKILPEKVVLQLAQLYELSIIEKKKNTDQEQEFAKSRQVTQEGKIVERMPVVVVIGHVDHGKTTLLDFIRQTRVAAKEKGGITQHLGAYQVKTSHGGIVFLDTPGHEAFSLMRARGIKVADIAILVIAADDGVMPQTIEAINHAKSAKIPIIVAINKIDKATAQQIETTKRQLAQHDLVPEDWGGQTVCVMISAKLGQGVSELLDVVSLQAQLMELTANISVPARGFVLESKLQKGRGPVATVICQHGELNVGDYFLAGAISGKVSSLVDTYGNRLTKVGPSTPVLVAGFSALPHAGDLFSVMSSDMMKKGQSQISDETRSAALIIKSTHQQAINLIIKTDNASSKEALVASINKLSNKVDQEFNVIHAAVGNVSDSDITFASATGSMIYGLHAKSEASAVTLAQKLGIKIKHFDIIYKLLEDLEATSQAAQPIKMVRKKIGEAVVLKVFDIKNLGVIAGAVVKTGRFTRDGKVVVWRGKQKVGEGSIKSLQRERKTVKEIHAGFECAFMVDGFDTWEVDDRVECFTDVPA